MLGKGTLGLRGVKLFSGLFWNVPVYNELAFFGFVLLFYGR